MYNDLRCGKQSLNTQKLNAEKRSTRTGTPPLMRGILSYAFLSLQTKNFYLKRFLENFFCQYCSRPRNSARGQQTFVQKVDFENSKVPFSHF